MKPGLPLIYIAAGLLVGCATTPATTAGDRAAAPANADCLRTSLIRDWDALDERNLIVYESGRRPYHVELTQSCFGLDFSEMLGFYDRRGDGRICGYGLDRVIVERAIPESCSVAAVDELTDEQAVALKERAESARARR
ncbi:MAG TPA: DUF6491 family protein [Gammaproteobacteria bacterium]|nr:DUF6491 family protein [Gammaproteobacteria bacterium]